MFLSKVIQKNIRVPFFKWVIIDLQELLTYFLLSRTKEEKKEDSTLPSLEVEKNRALFCSWPANVLPLHKDGNNLTFSIVFIKRQ